MQLAILSDIHDNFHNLILAIKEIKKRKIREIIFLGDFINPGVVKVMIKLGLHVFAVWGNNEGDKIDITKMAIASHKKLELAHDTYGFYKIDGRKFFLTHYPDLVEPMVKSGIFDAIFYGHDHRKIIRKVDDVLIVNPGEISAHKSGLATFAVYNTKTNKAEIIKLKNIVSVKTKISNLYLKKYLGF